MAMPEYVFPQDVANEALPDKFQRAGGLEVRDFFAAHALPLLMATARGTDADDLLKKAAKAAYRIADAMVSARGRDAGEA